MAVISFPYGKGTREISLPENRLRGVLVPGAANQGPVSLQRQESLVQEALEHPVGSPRLSTLAEGKKNIVLIASDHTRPVPSRIILPPMLEELRRGSPGAEITILVATGCHRETTPAELEAKFGPGIAGKERIVVHDCDSPDQVSLGTLPSGGNLVINRRAAEADLLVSEGFIEPHFFAGFSGGRKSVLPGVASRRTVVYNHNAEFIAHPKARTGVLEGNPIHQDMLWAARAAGLAFICNVVLNPEKEVIYAAAGDGDQAHRRGCAFLAERCHVRGQPADIVITSNGGYPLDQNIYQAVKGMTAAESLVRPGGVIIMLAKSNDGHGGEEFYKTFAEEKDLDRMIAGFLATPKETTRIDQWQSQIFARVLQRARVLFISDAPDGMVRDLHMTPVHSLEEALRAAEEVLGNPEAGVLCIPDGVSVIVE